MLKQDILRTYKREKGSRLKRSINCLRTPGVQAVIIYRFGHWLTGANVLLKIFLMPIYLFSNFIMRAIWGIEIAPTCKIAEGFYIGHHGGIFVGNTIIGKNCNISQGVIIGVAGEGDSRGIPVIGDNVYIAPGAKIFEKIHIGNNVMIGANAVIYEDIPDNAVAVLSPGYKIVSYKGNSRSRI